jgi:stress response protein YsnF
MPLYRINDFYSGYRSNPGQFDIRNFELYSDRNEHIGRVVDTLLDQAGNLQYLVVELGSRRAKHVLLPTQHAQIDPQNRYIYLQGLSPRQVNRLPAYHGGPAMPVAREPVQPVYRMRSLEESAPLEASAPLEGYYVAPTPAPVNPPAPSPQPPIPPYTPPRVEPRVEPVAAQQPAPPAVEYFTQSPAVVPSPPPVAPPETYRQQPRPEAIVPPPAATSEVAQEEVIPLLEERLIVDQKKRKVGEVVVRKEIETEIIEVPVQREKLIVEQVGPEPKQLAEIDLAEEQLPPLPRPEAQLPRIPRREP